jgi:mannose-6-phosphate isomerase-like protein (cupin superfamily)
MDQISVVSQNAIPPINTVDHDGVTHHLGELRDFRWNELLRGFMPDPAIFSVSWVRLAPGEVLDPHVHPIQSMLVFYAGTGEMIGDLVRPLIKDDVVVVPGGCVHGFVGGPEGLYGLSIQFGEGLYTAPEKPRVAFATGEHSLSDLLAYNQERVRAFADRPLFSLLASGVLEDPRKHKACLEALRVWGDGIEVLLFSRQATCSDPRYKDAFRRRTSEELGHDGLHSGGPAGGQVPSSGRRDLIIEAITNWFAFQMFVLDDVEKVALTCLVLGSADAAFDAQIVPSLRHLKGELPRLVPLRGSSPVGDREARRSASHAGVPDEASLAELLKNQSPADYANLKQVVREGWDMIEAMTDRVAELTRNVP